MATEGNIADYIGRRVDVSLFQGVAAGTRVPVAMSLAENNAGGVAITGAARLAQRFFLELMTEAGSIPSRPSRGSDFMREARTGQLRTTSEVEQAFYLAVDQIVDNLNGEEENDLPDDARFDRADLLEISLANGELKIKVAVRSMAGDAREVILPISTRTR